jgi:hypothetical protein
VKHATHVGLKAFHGFKTAHEPAKQIARVPVVGPALGLALLLGATVAGAIHGITDFEE